MTEAITVFFLFVLGAGVGSFISLYTYRIANQASRGRRSSCDKCGHELVWSDTIPILSYLILGGKCRYCKAKINHRYALFEVLMGCLFALSYLYLPLGVVELAIWYVILALFMGLFLTDLYYRKLPFVQVVVLTILCSIFMVLTEVIIEQKMYSLVLLDHLWSLIPLTGLFGIVFVLSRGKLIGGGDVLLGIPIAILLSWQGVLAVLLLASVLAVLFYIPLLSMKKIKPNTKLPFGSFLIVATLIVFFVVKLFVNFF